MKMIYVLLISVVGPMFIPPLGTIIVAFILGSAIVPEEQQVLWETSISKKAQTFVVFMAGTAVITASIWSQADYGSFDLTDLAVFLLVVSLIFWGSFLITREK